MPVPLRSKLTDVGMVGGARRIFLVIDSEVIHSESIDLHGYRGGQAF